MNTRAMLATLNELDDQLCSALGISRSCDATTLDEAIAKSAATTDRSLAGERGIRDAAAPPVAQSQLTDFLQAQVEARVIRDGREGNVVRSLTEGIRRMKKAGSLQGLGRQACAELCDALGFDSALLSFVEDDGFVVEESDHGLGGPIVIRRRGCVAERHCIRLRDTIRTNEDDVPADARLPGSARFRGLSGRACSSPNRGWSHSFTSAAAKAAFLSVTSIYWIPSPLPIRCFMSGC